MENTDALASGESAKAGGREWIGLAVLALPTMLLALDLSVLYLALPSISADLQPSSSQLLWMIDIYSFMIAGFLVTMGKLGDRIGRRKLLMIGAAVFGAASVLTAYSVSAEMLIATRALLGIAGATMMPSTLSLISNMFKDSAQRGMAIGIWMSCFMAGMAVGPLVGGLMLEWFWWGSVFMLGVPVMLLLLLTAPALLPEYKNVRAGTLEPTSIVLSLLAILSVVYGLKEIARSGPTWQSALAILVGAAFAAVFVFRQRRMQDPLLDLRLLDSRVFCVALGAMLLSSATMGGFSLLVNQYLQLVKGLSPLKAGLWLLPQTFCVISFSMAASAITRRMKPGHAIGGGLILAAVGLLLLTRIESATELTTLMIYSIIAFLGIGPMGVLATNLTIGSAPPEKAGSASALSETSGELGIAAGVAVLGSIASAVYRNQVEESIPINAPVEEAEAIRETLSGAIAMGDRLPEGSTAVLLDSAREAFTNGLNAVAALSSFVIFLFAVMAIILLRHSASSVNRGK